MLEGSDLKTDGVELMEQERHERKVCSNSLDAQNCSFLFHLLNPVDAETAVRRSRMSGMASIAVRAYRSLA